LGKNAIISNLKEVTVFESNMMRIQINDRNFVPDYVFRWLNTEKSRNHMRISAKRAVAQSSINQNDVQSLLVPLPPLPVQQKIAEILSSLDAKIQAEERKKRSLESIFKTLLELLMTGKIRVKFLNDK
jgi:type I restriction enzyme S subunit